MSNLLFPRVNIIQACSLIFLIRQQKKMIYKIVEFIIKVKILKYLEYLIIDQIMDHNEKKEQDYTKWDETIWLSVEKQISQFQKKVTEAMLKIGQLGKTKEEDFKIEPLLEQDVILGQDFYLQLIRPICVAKGYLPKQLPNESDLNEDQDSDSESSQQQKKSKAHTTARDKKQEKPKQPKKGGKKGSKNNQKNNDSEIRLKIVKQNFGKQLDLVLNSHSLERMQFEFGLKQKKLQLRLITFFYIAFYIRKNKEKQNIDQSQIFELVNIMSKIVRIFESYRGRSFFSGGQKKKKQQQVAQVSPTLILDMKICIKALKDHYKYTNRKIIINYPKLVYYTNYDKFFPTLDIKAYPSQIQFIQSVKKAFNIQKGTIATPTLILYRTMIGSGKTSASLSLSNLINQTKLVDNKNANLQVLYSCLIGSVRVQVGRYVYNNKQKFALAAMEKSIKDEEYYYPRIINSYSVRNQKIVDIIISDLDCSYHMLDRHHYTQREEDIFTHERANRKALVNVGKLDKQNIVMFIDEPTAFCKDVNSPATQKLFNILANYPPKVIILASATMPPKEQLKNTIKLIEQRNPGLQVFQVDSKQFQIGCQYCSFNGEIIFPHTNIKNSKDLQKIISLIEGNPFLLRLYTGPSLYFLLKRCQAAGMGNLPKIDDLPEIRQQDISKLTMKILKSLASTDDETIQEVCKLSADQANIDYKILEKQSDSDDDIFGTNQKQQEVKEKQQNKSSYVNFKNMLRQDAYKFLGGCLIGTSNPLEFAHTHFEKWFKIRKGEYIKPVKRLLQKYQKEVDDLQREIKLLEDKDRRQDEITKQISKLQTQKQPKMDFPDYKRINTYDHYNRYCKEKQPVHQSMLIKPMVIEKVAADLIQQVDDFVLKLLLCGVALYMEKGLPPKYLDKVEELASQNYLAYIITDQSLAYGTNFPISNVVLCDDLVTKLNMNEMFQLVGRAGRVGQSWTARAFLEQQGLQKLNNYIHSEDHKMSDEAQIFQQIAQTCLDNPQLTLRTTKSEIKYLNLEKPDDRIEITIKKKNKEDYHIFRKVTLVLYLDDQRILAHRQPYKQLNSYQLPQCDILYQDLPTKLNSKEQAIIDVQSYFKNEQQFIRATLDNACKRILKTVLDGKFTTEGQVNQFKPKVYQDYFNMKTNTFAVLIKCKEDVQVGNYKFEKLSSNAVQKFDDNLVTKIDKYMDSCYRLAKMIRDKPQQVLANDVKQVKMTHEDLLQRNKTKFYKQIVDAHLAEAQQEYNQLTASIEDKESLETAKQSVIILLVDKYAELESVQDKLYHVDRTVRRVWPHIKTVIEK